MSLSVLDLDYEILKAVDRLSGSGWYGEFAVVEAYSIDTSWLLGAPESAGSASAETADSGLLLDCDLSLYPNLLRDLTTPLLSLTVTSISPCPPQWDYPAQWDMMERLIRTFVLRPSALFSGGAIAHGTS